MAGNFSVGDDCSLIVAIYEVTPTALIVRLIADCDYVISATVVMHTALN